MKKELVFLLIGEERGESSFVRKVEQLIQVPVDAKTTFGMLFMRLVAYTLDAPNADLMVYKWFNERHYTDKEFVFQSDLTHIIPDPEIQMYAIFDLVIVKQN